MQIEMRKKEFEMNSRYSPSTLSENSSILYPKIIFCSAYVIVVNSNPNSIIRPGCLTFNDSLVYLDIYD